MLNFRPHSHGPLTCTKVNLQFKWKLRVKYNYITNANSCKISEPEGSGSSFVQASVCVSKIMFMPFILAFLLWVLILKNIFCHFPNWILPVVTQRSGPQDPGQFCLKLNLHETIIYNLFIRA